MLMDLTVALTEWQRRADIGVKPETQRFHRELVASISRAAQSLPQDVEAWTQADVDRLCLAIGHFSATRWNAMLSIIRALAPNAVTPPRRAVRMRTFVPPTQTEFAALLNEADRNRRCQIGLVLRFLCLTGLRIAEAHALRWADVRPDGIWVRPETSKNGRGRLVPILPDLPPVLERLRALEAARQDGLVLPPANPRAALARVSRRVLGQPWSPHLCRHFFATRCITAGVDLPTVARWLGHQDGGALLARTYYHLADEHSRAMAARVRLSGSPSEPPTRPAPEPVLGLAFTWSGEPAQKIAQN